jgi:ATP-dependent DNA helicase RecG
MNINDIEKVKSIIDNAENSQTEFKETTGQLERGMETICAFLNGTGGTLLFGVTDHGKMIGQEVADSTKRNIAEAINRLEPLAEVLVSYVSLPHSDKSIIALHVEEARFERPFCYKGRAYMRVESVTTTMPQAVYNELLMQRGGKYGWESMTNPDLQIADLDENTILGAVRAGIDSGRLPENTIREDIPSILEKFDLLHHQQLNNAAAVLFGKKFYDYPQCLLRMARFRGTDKNEFIDNQRVQGNIYNLLDAAMAFFFKHLSLSGKIEGLYREEELSIPYKALRECCINAFAHRFYHHPGSSASIAIYDDRVEITNSGAFPANISIERLLSTHDSQPQNPIIANVLYKSKVLESWGRGIGLMVDECRRVGISDPEFHADGGFVWVVFHYSHSTVGIPHTVTPQAPHKYPTSTPQVETIVHVIGKGMLSVKEIMDLLGLKDRKSFLYSYLYPAIEKDLVTPLYPDQPKHPRQKYRLTAKGLSLLK